MLLRARQRPLGGPSLLLEGKRQVGETLTLSVLRGAFLTGFCTPTGPVEQLVDRDIGSVTFAAQNGAEARCLATARRRACHAV
jgi:hypothetical protein